jgi:hypothetical protein
MWYMGWGNEAGGALPGWRSPVCYATSADGVHWDRPELNLYRFKMQDPSDPGGPTVEYSRNNIVFNLEESELGMDSPTVVKDLDDPDLQFRYKMSYWHRLPTGDGIFQAHSPDGIHWTHIPKILVDAGDRNTFHFDPFRDKWVIVTHPAATFYELERFGEPNGNFSRTRVDMEPRDKEPPTRSTDIYSFTAFNYEGMQIGLAELYGRKTTNRWVSYLAWSYDGVKWTIDPERVQWMPWDEQPGTFDCWRRNIHNGGVIRRGDELWIYFSGRSQGKDEPGPGGSLRTRPFTVGSDRLYINAEIAASGGLKAGFVDPDGRPFEGFGLEDCDGIWGDNVAHEVSWRGSTEIRSLGGRTARLVMELSEASLYSFRLAD